MKSKLIYIYNIIKIIWGNLYLGNLHFSKVNRPTVKLNKLPSPPVWIKLDFTAEGLGLTYFLESFSLVSHLKLHFIPFVKAGAGPRTGGKLTWQRRQHSVSYKPINLPNMWQFFQLSARQMFFQISPLQNYMKFGNLVFEFRSKHLILNQRNGFFTPVPINFFCKYKM